MNVKTNAMRYLVNLCRLMTLFLAALLVVNCSKYEDFVENEYEYTAVYFARQEMERTVIPGEWMRVGVGVMLGGKLKNNTSEKVLIELRDDIIPEGYSALPNNYYRLVDESGKETSTITIASGSHQGFIYVSINDEFVDDEQATEANYALGFSIKEASTDSILAEKEATVVAFKYINTYQGYYYREGTTTIYINGTEEVDTILSYDSNTEDNAAWELSTLQKDKVKVTWNNSSGIRPDLDLLINNENKLAIIGNNVNSEGTEPGTIISITDDGDSSYDPESRTFNLNYSYSFIDGQGNLQKYKVNDQLIFRNRVVDGVNQWFDE